jgi:hypothetical protein
MTIHPFFNLVGIEPGMVITFQFGAVDFRVDVPLHILKELYNSGFPYLKLTKQGEKALTPFSEMSNNILAGPMMGNSVKPSFMAGLPEDSFIPESSSRTEIPVIPTKSNTKKRARKSK